MTSQLDEIFQFLMCYAIEVGSDDDSDVEEVFVMQ